MRPAGSAAAPSPSATCPQVKEHYDRRRAAGDEHAAAMRNLFNRFLGCLHHCLQTGQLFDPAKAFPSRQHRRPHRLRLDS